MKNKVFFEEDFEIIPHFFIEFLDTLERKCNTPGLFRCSGNSKEMDLIKKRIENGERLDGNKIVSQYTGSVHNLTALIRKYLRELPTPVLDSSFIHKCLTEKRTIKSVDEIKKIVFKVEPRRREMLARLLRVWKATSRSNTNQMTSIGIGKVVLPSLFKLTIDNFQIGTPHIPQKIVELLIDNNEIIFEKGKYLSPHIKFLKPSVIFDLDSERIFLIEPLKCLHDYSYKLKPKPEVKPMGTEYIDGIVYYLRHNNLQLFFLDNNKLMIRMNNNVHIPLEFNERIFGIDVNDFFFCISLPGKFEIFSNKDLTLAQRITHKKDSDVPFLLSKKQVNVLYYSVQKGVLVKEDLKTGEITKVKVSFEYIRTLRIHSIKESDKFIAVSGGKGLYVRVYSKKDLNCKYVMKTTSKLPIESLSMAPDNSMLACCHHEGINIFKSKESLMFALRSFDRAKDIKGKYVVMPTSEDLLLVDEDYLLHVFGVILKGKKRKLIRLKKINLLAIIKEKIVEEKDNEIQKLKEKIELIEQGKDFQNMEGEGEEYYGEEYYGEEYYGEEDYENFEMVQVQ